MEYNKIGKISKTHGLKGEVLIFSETSFGEERFAPSASLYMKRGESFKELKISTHREVAKGDLISFVGYEDINLITPYIGEELYCEKDYSLLKEGEVFLSDYIGMTCNQFSTSKGVVKDVVSDGRLDYLLVLNNEGKEKLVPILDVYIKSVNTDKKEILIDDVEGLL